MSMFQSMFAVFKMPVYEFPVTCSIRISEVNLLQLMGYIDMFGNYFDMSMFPRNIVKKTKDEYDKYKMSEMQKTSESGQDTQKMSFMYQ